MPQMQDRPYNATDAGQEAEFYPKLLLCLSPLTLFNHTGSWLDPEGSKTQGVKLSHLKLSQLESINEEFWVESTAKTQEVRLSDHCHI